MTVDSAVFYTNDIGGAVDFYTKVLGLTLEYRQADRYVSFMLDNGVRLGIKKAVQEREKPGAQTVFFGTDAIEGLYEECRRQGLRFHKPLDHMPGFGRNFAIYDPDDNKVEFVQRD